MICLKNSIVVLCCLYYFLDFKILTRLIAITIASIVNYDIIIKLLSNVIRKNIFILYCAKIVKQVQTCKLKIISKIKNITIDLLRDVSKTFFVKLFKNR